MIRKFTAEITDSGQFSHSHYVWLVCILLALSVFPIASCTVVAPIEEDRTAKQLMPTADRAIVIVYRGEIPITAGRLTTFFVGTHQQLGEGDETNSYHIQDDQCYLLIAPAGELTLTGVDIDKKLPLFIDQWAGSELNLGVENGKIYYIRLSVDHVGNLFVGTVTTHFQEVGIAEWQAIVERIRLVQVVTCAKPKLEEGVTCFHKWPAVETSEKWEKKSSAG